MDNQGPRSGSVTPNSGSGYQFERPLPPIPGSSSIPVPWETEGAVGGPRLSSASPDQSQVDTTGIYDEDDATGEGPEMNFHGVAGGLLDIYPSRSNSSLSVASHELLTRAPYLEGVSNSSLRPDVAVDDHFPAREDSPESSRSHQRGGSGAPSTSAPVSLREFLVDGPSASRSTAARSPRSPEHGLFTAEDSLPRSRTSQSRPQGVVWGESNLDSMANVSIRAPTRTPHRRMRSGRDGISSSGASGDLPLLDYDSSGQIRYRPQPSPPPPPPEFVVPRWQPDAEVTFCPICRTQFSFFVRKHHCRKCGRVVCNSCSPHRITIPYQYIVQPPIDSGSPSSSDPHPPRRTDTAGSLEVAGLGGGERVRLCNPCVPDPNTAPPTYTHQPSSLQGRHSRSASTTAVPQNTPGSHSPNANAELATRAGHLQWRPREPSNFGTPNRYLQPETLSHGTSLNERGDRSLRPEDPQSRSRSSTVGSSCDETMTRYPPSPRGRFQTTLGAALALERSHSVRGHPQYRPLIQNTQSDHSLGMASQGPPNPPSQAQPPRRQIAEDDECWVCFEELPERTLPNWEQVRADHVIACLARRAAELDLTASGRNSLQPPPQLTPGSSAGHPQVTSSSPATAPTANTPEARSAARDQAHAAVVTGQNRPSPSIRHFGGTILPYKASEKDIVDDAECSICFEEYEVGQDMARLQCLCRFHLTCIRGWYNKMPGRCPLHDHDGGF